MASNSKRDGLYRWSLRGNAVFSTLSGLTLAAAPAMLSEWMGIAPGYDWLLRSIGIGLVIFAAVVAWVSMRPVVRPYEAVFIALADFGWVVGTAALLIMAPDAMNGAGKYAAIGVACMVFTFAYLQLLGARRFLRETNPDLGDWRYCISVDVDAGADEAWRIVSDLGGISRYLATLTSSEVRDGAEPGIGAIRTCKNTQGQVWSEKVTNFQPEGRVRSFNVRFLDEEPEFPFPMKALYGGWSVEALGAGARINVWWSATPSVPVLPWMVVVLMSASLEKDFPPLIARMAADAKGEPIPPVVRGRVARAVC